MWIRKITTGVVLLASGSAAMAQGLFRFDDIPGISEDPIISIDIGSVAIGFVRGMLREVDPATADVLNGLRGIALRVYQGDDNASKFNNFIGDVTNLLEEDGWQSIMRVQDENANVRIHMRMTEQEVTGMAVMLFDGAEAVFISIDGSISASDLGRVMAAFNAQDFLSGMPQITVAPPRGDSRPGND
jgi:hypothetical protein